MPRALLPQLALIRSLFCSSAQLLLKQVCFVQMNVDKLKKVVGAVRTGGKGSVRRCFWLFNLVTVFHKYCYIGFATSSSVSCFQHVMCFYIYPFCLCESIASDLECFFRMTDLCPVDRCCSLCRNAKIEACSLSILIIIQTYWCCISRFIRH